MKIKIIGRRWFQKSYGNTYHTAEVYVDGEFIGKSDETYGYGDQYLQTAHEILMAAGFMPKTGERKNGFQSDYSYFLSRIRENREDIEITCHDVKREKDL